ncbi:MAG: aminoglycoside phosphotransferase family protein [Clostridia bacterium]|nr:aminoglycoside phosphotransferase family protein [Clostridia bacterium]
MSFRKGLLELPDPREVEALVGFVPAGRRTLHEWPLSCVELISSEPFGGEEAERGADYRILKSQLARASAEGAFYRYAKKIGGHPLLLDLPECGEKAGSAGAKSAGGTEWLVLPYCPGKAEDWTALSNEALRARVRELSASFRPLDGAPVFIDWTDRGRFLEDLEADLAALVSGGGEDPDLLTGEERDELFRRIERDAAVCWSEEIPVGLLHGDLKGDNLLVSGPGGSNVKVIDWQRPMRAPLPLEEELSLLLTRPESRSSGSFHRLACAAEAHWYAWAWRTCLPWPFVRANAVKYARMCLRG